ncbi:DUF445 family protein, partial [Pseudomonas aeruginosa]|uniref:DUF445 family protein n=1 Tax=Pseudomonas aeruginosa TaxID=287 RepID=UPI0031B6EFB6
VPKERCIVVKPGDVVKVKDIEIHALDAFDRKALITLPADQKAAGVLPDGMDDRAVNYLFKTPGGSLYHSGDSHYSEAWPRADAVKSYLKEDEAFNRYLSELWGDLREWLKADINSEDSRVKERIARAGQWFGETLIADDALRASLTGHLEQ